MTTENIPFARLYVESPGIAIISNLNNKFPENWQFYSESFASINSLFENAFNRRVTLNFTDISADRLLNNLERFLTKNLNEFDRVLYIDADEFTLESIKNTLPGIYPINAMSESPNGLVYCVDEEYLNLLAQRRI